MAVPARVEASEFDDLATAVARTRPFAIVIAENLYESDPDELTALARDVRSRIVLVPTGSVSPEYIQRDLVPTLSSAFMAWG